MTYTVKLIGLKCLVSQEDDGDEIYLTLNRELIWAMPGDYVMHENPQRPNHVKEVDFVAGQLLTSKGWQPIPAATLGASVFGGRSGRSEIEVWDHDNFSRDDYFGKITGSENEIGHGHITGVAAQDAAHYVLTYEILAEE
ncbi:MAG: hypothetical protein K8J31_21555 [Anaerolineae bacterium]|nr:hypothetical protein [Anaerolineae bacterium]